MGAATGIKDEVLRVLVRFHYFEGFPGRGRVDVSIWHGHLGLVWSEYFDGVVGLGKEKGFL